MNIVMRRAADLVSHMRTFLPLAAQPKLDPDPLNRNRHMPRGISPRKEPSCGVTYHIPHGEINTGDRPWERTS